MNIWALLIGTMLATFAVIRFKRRELENTAWLYPLLLASFPIFYWIFAIYASDYAALPGEIAVGLVYFAIAYIACRWRSSGTSIILAIFFISHAVYDAMHHAIFVNEGTPVWWPEFCGSADLVFGFYLLCSALFAKKFRETF